MSEKTKTDQKEFLAVLEARQHRVPPVLAHGVAVGFDPTGMLVAMFYSDHYAIASEFVMEADDEGTLSINPRDGLPVGTGVRNVVASVRMSRDAADQAVRMIATALMETSEEGKR